MSQDTGRQIQEKPSFAKASSYAKATDDRSEGREKEAEPVLKGKEKETKETDEKQKIRIKIRAYDHKIIDQSTRTIVDAAKRSGAQVIGPVPLPTEKKKYTVLKSSFVHKNARNQYEMRIHKRLVDIIDVTQKTIDSLSNLNLPAGVDVEIKM